MSSTILQDFSDDLWEYISDLPYMPSRADRDRLVNNGDQRRVKLWDYFFQINPDDVKYKHNARIAQVRDQINSAQRDRDQIIDQENQQIRKLEDEIKALRAKRRKKGWRRLGLALVTGVIGAIIESSSNGYLEGYFAILPALYIFFSFTAFAGLPGVGRKERQAIVSARAKIDRADQDFEKRKKDLEAQIQELVDHLDKLLKQLPPVPGHAEVIKWLDADLDNLREHSVDLTGLGNRLVEIRFEGEDDQVSTATNPLVIRGPGELQDPDRIPRSFDAEHDADRALHLRARRLAHTEERGFEILYAVYYLEYIMVADDMLATCGFFYDAINGKTYSEHVTEQYYTDVVAIATLKEDREIEIGLSQDSDKTIKVLVEDAPTFSLSLKSAEKRTVTFVNNEYFYALKDAYVQISEILNSGRHDGELFRSVVDAHKTADNAVKALRAYLRRHKGVDEHA